MKKLFAIIFAFTLLGRAQVPTVGKVDVTWNRSVTPGVTNYNVYTQRLGQTTNYKVKHLANRAACTLDLPSGIAFRVWCTAVKNTLESDPSNVITVTAP